MGQQTNNAASDTNLQANQVSASYREFRETNTPTMLIMKTIVAFEKGMRTYVCLYSKCSMRPTVVFTNLKTILMLPTKSEPDGIRFPLKVNQVVSAGLEVNQTVSAVL